MVYVAAEILSVLGLHSFLSSINFWGRETNMKGELNIDLMKVMLIFVDCFGGKVLPLATWDIG